MELRPTPKHIDRASRTIELLLVAMVPFALVRPYFEVTGLMLMVVLPVLYARMTLGKPEAFLRHAVYAAGMPMRGLLHPAVTSLMR